MRHIIEKWMPANDDKRKWLSVGIAVVVAGLLTVWAIYGIGNYGIALFIFVPLLIGAAPVVLYGSGKDVSKKQAWHIGVLTLGVYTAGLLIFAIEGVICIAMAAPFGLALTWLGTRVGYELVKRTPGNAPTTLLLLIGVVPITAFVEKDTQTPLQAVVTSVDIQAAPGVVWKHVVVFPQLDEPTELLFKAGIAYPINATIAGSGVGAVRHCNFTTGSFVEPITVWDEPHLLKFSVEEQPHPMKELSFWDVDAPHLHDYFVSKQGQFELTNLPNGNTRLTGTTWYYHKIRPSFYWQLWSNYIIHKIHYRVLNHIKNNAEREG